MFFILSKVLLFLVRPFTWVVMLLVYGVALKKRRALKWSLALMLIFSNAFIADEAMRAWEIQTVKHDEITETYDYVILLGGFSSWDSTYKRINFYWAADRMLQAVDLYKLGKAKKLFISGGTGSLLYPDITESDKVRDFLIRIGVSFRDVQAEIDSKNTHENAVETAKRLMKRGKSPKCLLVTSANHMRRAMGCYQRVGMDVTAFSAQRYSGPRKCEFSHLVMPQLEALEVWSVLIKEVVGTIVYRMMGYL